jgi:N-acetylmuramoyl-L-alanine amidase
MQTRMRISSAEFSTLARRLFTVALLIGAIASTQVLALEKAATRKRVTSKTGKASPKSRAMPVAAIQEAEQMLADLGYWTGPVDGKMDDASRHALVAFQKVERRTPTGKLTDKEIAAIREAARPPAREKGFSHIEVDLSRQVLFMVDASGQVSRVLPVSSGNGKEFTSEGWTRRAITPTGRFKVHRKIDGWRKAPLGRIYYPNYFLDGVAIHGYPSVPTRAASHGCVRIPMFAAIEFSEMVPVGTWVIVHDGTPARAVDREDPASR